MKKGDFYKYYKYGGLYISLSPRLSSLPLKLMLLSTYIHRILANDEDIGEGVSARPRLTPGGWTDTLYLDTYICDHFDFKCRP